MTSFLLIEWTAGAVLITGLSAAATEDSGFRISRIDVDVEAGVVDVGLHNRIIINPEMLCELLGKIQFDMNFHLAFLPI